MHQRYSNGSRWKKISKKPRFEAAPDDKLGELENPASGHKMQYGDSPRRTRSTLSHPLWRNPFEREHHFFPPNEYESRPRRYTAPSARANTAFLHRLGRPYVFICSFLSFVCSTRGFERMRRRRTTFSALVYRTNRQQTRPDCREQKQQKN